MKQDKLSTAIIIFLVTFVIVGQEGAVLHLCVARFASSLERDRTEVHLNKAQDDFYNFSVKFEERKRCRVDVVIVFVV